MNHSPEHNDPATDTGQRDQRARSPRTNLLLSATIESGSLKAPVRIRNMSETGALIDGAALPSVGADLTLRRLAIDIGATVIWRLGSRCGIRFDGTASVPDWVAGVRREADPPQHGQRRVDAIQAAIRSGSPMRFADGPSGQPDELPSDLEQRIAEELAYVKRLLDSVGDQLTDDPVVLARHGALFQNFDIACQVLDQLATVMSAPDRVAAAGAISMGDLRARLLRIAMF